MLLCAILLALSPQADHPFRAFSKPIGSTEWNGAIEAPAKLTSIAQVSPPGEKGEPLVVNGRIFKVDGKTPAGGVLLYLYHTDAEGLYSRGRDRGNERRHGILRGWLLTGPDGRYEIRTIKPGLYPSRNSPAHIHATLTADGHPEHWIEDFEFEGDPFIYNEQVREARAKGAFSPILRLEKRNGVWHGTRDIKLERPSRENGGIWP